MRLYYRLYVNTTYLSWASLFYFITMFVTGFTFVVVVTLVKDHRKDPFTGKDGTHKDIVKAVILAAIIFFASGFVVLREKSDLSEYCNKNGTHDENNLQASLPLFESLSLRDVHSPL